MLVSPGGSDNALTARILSFLCVFCMFMNATYHYYCYISSSYSDITIIIYYNLFKDLQLGRIVFFCNLLFSSTTLDIWGINSLQQSHTSHDFLVLKALNCPFFFFFLLSWDVSCMCTIRAKKGKKTPSLMIFEREINQGSFTGSCTTVVRVKSSAWVLFHD